MSAPEPTTLVIRGEGGGLTVMDVPTVPARREIWDEYVAKGLYRILGRAPEGAEVNETGDLVTGRVQHADPEKAKPGKVIDVADLEPYVPVDETDTDGADDERPSNRAGIKKWQAFAVAQGADPEIVAVMSKDELVAEFGDDGEDDD